MNLINLILEGYDVQRITETVDLDPFTRLLAGGGSDDKQGFAPGISPGGMANHRPFVHSTTLALDCRFMDFPDLRRDFRHDEDDISQNAWHGDGDRPYRGFPYGYGFGYSEGALEGSNSVFLPPENWGLS